MVRSHRTHRGTRTVDKFAIEGGSTLSGVVEVSGAKNAALPIMCATLLLEGKTTLRNVPDLSDVKTTIELLECLGMRGGRADSGTIELEPSGEVRLTAPYDIVRKMRASVAVLGPLLARHGRARVSLPGGCVIGLRPIDLHLKGLRALGAQIEIEHGYIVASAAKLRGAHIYLGGHFGPTVLGTANVMMAATLAEGTTVIEGAACEPEVADLAHFLVKTGARIDGIGTPRLEITGVSRLQGAEHTVIPDRIEAGTFLAAAAITGGHVTVAGAEPEHSGSVLDKLRDVGVTVSCRDGQMLVEGAGRPHATEVTTLSYPGFPTDLQAQMMALLTIADGTSIITEKVYPDRFMHIAELARMGADIRKEGPNAIIVGRPALSGAPVMASDLRASAALVVAALAAKGETVINRVYHIDRGYERIEEKLAALGARITRVEE